MSAGAGLLRGCSPGDAPPEGRRARRRPPARRPALPAAPASIGALGAPRPAGRRLASCAALVLLSAMAPARAQGPGPADADRLHREALRTWTAGRPAEALPLFRRALGAAPGDALLRRDAFRCLLAVGDARLGTGDLEAAALAYAEARDLEPTAFAARYRLGAVRYRQLRDREGLALARALAEDFPRRAEAFALLGRFHYRAGDNAAALDCFRRSLALDPAQEELRALLEKVRREETVEGELELDLSAPHFSIKYDGARDPSLGRVVGTLLEAAYRDVLAFFGRAPAEPLSVVVYPGKTFRAVTGADPWVAGLYDGKIRLPAKNLARAAPGAVRRLLAHEVAHAFVRSLGGPRVPAWLHEGLAQVAEGRSAHEARRRLGPAPLPSLRELRGSLAAGSAAAARRRYAAACAWTHFLLQGGRPTLLLSVLDELSRGTDPEEAFRRVFGLGLAELHAAWRDASRR
ncbi:MAG: tetratricopeptide repeat protein [Planctomycetota bacterium]|nr:MAG: tetratricopeptide repeat protein [Planctomycetota bacterium]